MIPDEISRLLALLPKREEEICAGIVAWSNVNSGSTHVDGVARMAALMSAQLERLTPNVVQFTLPETEELRDDGRRVPLSLGPGVRAVCRPDAPVQILLSGHLDTVFPRDHPFQEARGESGRLIGPGVADMKGGLAVMIESLRLLESAPFRSRLGWEVILNPDEEIGSPGSAAVLAEAAARHRAALVFEPALPDGSLVSGRPGTGNFLVRVTGRPAHAGRDFASGRSAIVALARMIPGFHELNREPGMIVNVGRLSGGGALNIVPETASCWINVRVDSVEDASRADECIRNIATESGRDGVVVEVDGTFSRPPKLVTPALTAMLEQFQHCAGELGFDLGWGTTGGASDGNNLAAAGLVTADGLGVRGGGIHTSDEFLEIDSVAERISLCSYFLLRLARGDFVLR